MLGRCHIFPAFVNQNLKLNSLLLTTCIRKYAMTYDEEERERKVKNAVIKVNVIHPDQKVESMTLEQAQRMAKRRDYKMTKLLDPPKFASYAGRDVYEMLTKSQHVKQTAEDTDNDTDSKLKEKKLLTISASIAAHDVMVKLKQIKKLLLKQHIVALIIESDGTGEMLKERVQLVQDECQEVSKITVVNKKKSSVLTMVPNINDSGETHKTKKHHHSKKETVGTSAPDSEKSEKKEDQEKPQEAV